MNSKSGKLQPPRPRGTCRFPGAASAIFLRGGKEFLPTRRCDFNGISGFRPNSLSSCRRSSISVEPSMKKGRRSGVRFSLWMKRLLFKNGEAILAALPIAHSNSDSLPSKPACHFPPRERRTLPLHFPAARRGDIPVPLFRDGSVGVEQGEREPNKGRQECRPSLGHGGRDSTGTHILNSRRLKPNRSPHPSPPALPPSPNRPHIPFLHQLDGDVLDES